MKAIPLLTICSACVLVSGCASDSTDYYLRDSFGFKEVCLVDNKNVPPSFFIALRQAIQDKGLQVRTVSKTEQSCPVTVYYEAKYNLAYLKDARLLLTTEGHPTDIVNLRKNVEPATLADPASDSEPKIRDMVNRLLQEEHPGRHSSVRSISRVRQSLQLRSSRLSEEQKSERSFLQDKEQKRFQTLLCSRQRSCSGL